MIIHDYNVHATTQVSLGQAIQGAVPYLSKEYQQQNKGGESEGKHAESEE